MKKFVEVNKVLGENIICTVKQNSRDYNTRRHDWNYQIDLKIFCNNLKAKGYENLTKDGNYIFATKGNERVTFYFISHSPQNTNYCIAPVLKYKVDYFVFFNTKTLVAYLVGYGIIREYCKQIKSQNVFYGNYQKPKMFIPDSWAHAQKINTMLLY